jgi:outer membrane scaffolding protein for murein synthesis (MipA/OmpV family)
MRRRLTSRSELKARSAGRSQRPLGGQQAQRAWGLQWTRRLAIAALCVPLIAFAQADDDAGRPRWEAGLVVGAGRVADYPGADQSHARGLVAPVVIYRGPVLRIDADGIRGRLNVHPDIEFNLSASGAFNARDNDARAGMPGLDYLFGVGPQVIYKGWRAAPGAPALHVKLHALLSTDFRHVDSRGATLQTEFRWRVWPSAPARITLGVEPTWASGALMRYFYEVAPSQALPGRPAYAARAGYLGTELKLTATRRFAPTLSGFVGVRGLLLHGATNDASPLLRSRANWNVGAGVLWTPWQSAARAEP